MSLNLDKRHRAMLREMGVRVWSPMEAPANIPAVESAPAVQAAPAKAEAPAHAPVAIDAVAVRARSAPVASAPVARPQPATALSAASSEGPTWQMGEALALYADTAHAGGPRWLVLAETPASALQGGFNPFDGRCRQAARQHAACCKTAHSRQRDAGTSGKAGRGGCKHGRPHFPMCWPVRGLTWCWSWAASRRRPCCSRTSPSSKLRGQVHQLQGVKLIVTLDAPYLLRNPLDKAKAWEDLCLAMSVISNSH